MFRLHRLSSVPECFEPISFQSGVNLILGERSDGTDPQGRKVNGVGKSVCVEFLHFALCRQFSQTRVSSIPEGVLPEDLVVVLDLTIGKERLQIRRSIANANQPTIVHSDGIESVFESLDEATLYLGELLFAGAVHGGQVSFRKLMSVLMRDERSEFKNVVNPHDTARRAADDIHPHLFLMGIDVSAFQQFDRTVKQLDSDKKVLKALKNELTDGNKIKIADVPAKLNEEKRATEKIGEALTTLRADPAFEAVEGELNDIETQLVRLRGERKKLSFQIDQIRSIPLPERIDADDIKIVYDRVKSGLGDFVEKSLEQAKAFKAEIEQFQQTLRETELVSLEKSRSETSSLIRALSDRHSELTRQVDNRGVLAELRTGLEVATRRTDQYHRLAAQFRQYEAKFREVAAITAERSDHLREIQALIERCGDIEDSLNETIVSIHEEIQQSSRASFRFVVDDRSTTKRPVSFDVRIQDDGSHSVNHIRVFIYDFALMIDQVTKAHHPRFLLHDNILEVDRDTLVRCLNFVNNAVEDGEDIQYILTLNRDELDGELINDLKLDIDGAKRASFTKAQQFLRTRYQEM